MTSTPTGDKLISDVLSGGYNVQPVPLPNSLFKDKSTKVYDSGITKTDILLTLGYATSGAPKYIGTKIFPKDPNNPGITKKKIISNPCKVILRL
jgi:hypothetical protein